MKKTLATIGILGALGAGGTFTADRAIDPYTDKGTVLEIATESNMDSAGENKIELSKAEPSATLSRWNGDGLLTIKYSDVKAKGNRAFLTNRMEWKGGKEEVHAYPLPAGKGMEDGGFEIEVVLNEKPDKNSFDFAIEGAENLYFAYQDPAEYLHELEVSNSTGEQPENVKGSYAVYHATKRDHREGALNYGSGKLFHIYRPKAIDANGVERWSELTYDGKGTMTVTVPQDFLDSATYPIRVDPTVGYTGIPASTSRLTQDQLECQVSGIDANASGVLTTVVGYGEATTTPAAWRAALIDNATGNNRSMPMGSMGNTTFTTPAHWATSTARVGVPIIDNAYRLCYQFDASTGAPQNRYFDTGFPSGETQLSVRTYSNADTDAPTQTSPTASTARKAIYFIYSTAEDLEEQEVVQSFFTSGSFIAPENISSTTVELWGAGGGATTGVGGGGGGAYSRSSGVSVTEHTSYTVTIGTSAANTNGATTTFNSTTVVAGGGTRGGAGGAGGQASLGTGDVKYSGGAGFLGSGYAQGGGGAGDAGDGVAGTSANVQNAGGETNGGASSQPSLSTDLGWPQGGGGSASSTTQVAGGRGEARIMYKMPAPSDFPFTASRSHGRSVSPDPTSLVLTMPSGIVSGDLLIAFVSTSDNPDIGIDGWTRIGIQSITNEVTQAVFYKRAVGGDTGTATSTTAESFTYEILRIKNGGTPGGTAASASGSSAPNPPSRNSGAYGNYLWIASASSDIGISGGAYFNSCPLEYFNCVTQLSRSAGGSNELAVAETLKTNQTEDPAAFGLSASTDYIAWTISVPFSEQAAPGGGTPDGGPPIFYFKNVDVRYKNADVRVKD